MPHRDVHRVYTRRVNSNGGDVMPAICATICKGVQNQLDKSGCYVLDFFHGAAFRADALKKTGSSGISVGHFRPPES